MKTILFSMLCGSILLITSCGTTTALQPTPPLLQGTNFVFSHWDNAPGISNPNGKSLRGKEIRVYSNFVVIIDNDDAKRVIPIDSIAYLEIL